MMALLLFLTLCVVYSNAQTYNYCGTSYATMSCANPCPSGLNSACPTGTSCFAGTAATCSIHPSPPGIPSQGKPAALTSAPVTRNINPTVPNYNYPTYNDKLPSYQDWFQNFTNCGYSKKYAMLSFDDGPFIPGIAGTESDTIKMLDALQALQVPASFWLLGYRIELYPQLAQEIVRRGHSVGPHSFNHPFLMNGSLPQDILQFTNAKKTFENILGVTPQHFRPPYGEMDYTYGNALRTAVQMEPVMWNFDLKDWDIVLMTDNTKWNFVQQQYVNSLFAASQSIYNHTDPPSMIVLGHDYHSTAEMVTGYVNTIKNRGYTFVDLKTCYAQWLADNSYVSPCLPECTNFVQGQCIPATWNTQGCVQPSSLQPPPKCVPNCAGNPCSIQCGLSCDVHNICVNGVPTCTPQCTGKSCGSDGCGGLCTPGCGMASCSSSGQCIVPTLPDLNTAQMCRPVNVRSIPLTSTPQLAAITSQFSATSNLTDSFDGGFNALITLNNNGPCIANLTLRVATPAVSLLYGLSGYTLVDSALTPPLNPTPSSIDIIWGSPSPFFASGQQSFLIQYIQDPSQSNLFLASMPCWQSPVIQVVAAQLGTAQQCVGYTSAANEQQNSFQIILKSILLISLSLTLLL